MNGPNGPRIAEVVRIVVAVIAGAASSLGYVEYVGPDRIVGNADPDIVRPDAWYGKDGRAQNARIDALERYEAADEVRMGVLEKQEIPPDWLKEQVNKIEARIMFLEKKIDDILVHARKDSSRKP